MNKIINANCLDGLKELPDNSVDSIVTDPPYGLSFMGKSWDYDVPKVEIWRECLRVLKPGGHLLSFFGTRTYHRGVVQIEDAGFEIRDQIGWAYGSGFPKSHNLKGDWQGWGTALKPAWEPICVARKPLIGTVAENVLEHGTGAINIDGCRVGAEKRFNAAAGNKPGTNSLNMSVVGMPQDAEGKECEGRWPANLIHDGSEEVLAQFPNTKPSRAANRGLCNSGCLGGQHDTGPTRKEGTDYIRGHNDLGGSAARFFKSCGYTEDLCEGVSVAAKTMYQCEKHADFAQRLVAILVRQEGVLSQEELQVILGYIGNCEKCSQLLNLVLNAVRSGSIDIIATTINLLKSYGYALPAIEKNTNSGKQVKEGEGKGQETAMRFLYCAKTSKTDRNEGCEDINEKPSAGSEFRPNHTEKAAQGADGTPYGRWKPLKNNHPTVKPTDLMRYLCRLVTPPGGVVLDPFAGSGSTGKAAVLEGFGFIGMEREAEYCQIAEKRIAAAKAAFLISARSLF